MAQLELLKKSFVYIIICILALVIIFQRSCGPTNEVTKHPTVKIDGVKYDVLKHTTDTFFTPAKSQVVYKPGAIIYKDTTIYVQIPSEVDTNSILKNYFAINVYDDTLHLKDSLGYVAVRDSITHNFIKGRTFDAHINRVVIRDSVILSKAPKNQVYIGGSLGFIKPMTTSIGVDLLLKTKSDKLYVVNVGYTSNLNLYAQGTILWKISLRRNKTQLWQQVLNH